MRWLLSTALLSLAALCAADEDSGPQAPYLKSDDFWDKVDGSKGWVIAFVAPWCGHCKSLKPEYGIADQALKNDADKVQLALFDADADRDFAAAFEVTGYPTIKYFEKGHAPKDAKAAKAYDGPRDAEGIVQWVNNKFGTNGRIVKPPSPWKELDGSNFDDIAMDEDNDVLVAFTAPWCGHCKALKPAWGKVGAALKNEKNCIVANVDADKHRDLGTRFEVTGFPTIKFFPKGKKTPEEYNSGRDEASILKFLNDKCGTKRTITGGLTEEAGRIAKLDKLAKEYVNGGKAADILEKIEEAAKDSKAETAKWYVKSMKKVIEKGAEFPAKEAKRLKGMIDGGKVKAEKIDEFYYRMNIMKAFAGRKADSKDEL